MAQRPKRNNSPINSKHQPMKAFYVPLSSLVRNTSPTRRRTSPSSPGLPSDKKNRFRRSTDVNNANEHRTLLSPLGSKVHLQPVVKEKSGKNIRRTNSLETLSTSYINGQWPRDNAFNLTSGSGLCNKSTQTQWESDPEESSCPTLELRKSKVISNIGSREIFRQCLQRTKQQSSSQPSHGKQSPVQGDHLTFSQYYPEAYSHSKPVPIPQVPLSPKSPSLHTRHSVEGLNIELEGLDLETKSDQQVFARTPPDGHRHPAPGLKQQSAMRNVDTQTDCSWIDTNSHMSPSRDKRSPISPRWIVSPPPEKSPVKSASVVVTSSHTLHKERESPTVEVGNHERESSPTTEDVLQHIPKYASSPKPNNSFWFARMPPDGAEIVPLYVEEMESATKVDCCSSCPDTTKSYIQFSEDSPFQRTNSVA